MARRSAVRTFVAAAVTAILVGVGGAVHADTINVDGDLVAVGDQGSISLGQIGCGVTTTRQFSMWVKRAGNSPQNTFTPNSSVQFTLDTNGGPFTVTQPVAQPGIPSTWVSNGDVTAAVAAVVSVTPTGSSPAGSKITVTGTEHLLAGGIGLTKSVDVPISWTTSPNPCAVKTNTSISLTCPASVVYTGSPLTPCTATLNGTNLPGGAAATVSYSTNTLVGTATVSASYAGDSTHNPSSATASFAIAKAPTTTTVNCPASATYTGSPLTPCTAQVTGAGGLSADVQPVTHTDNTNVGTAHASATYAGDANHSSSTGNGSFSITGASASCDVSGYVGLFDGDAHGATGSCTGLGGTDLTGHVDFGQSFTDVPGGSAHWSFSAPNYLGQSGDVAITIGKATSSISLTCSDTQYTGDPQETCEATVTGDGGLAEDVDVTYTDNTDAGTAHAKAVYAGDDDHSGTSAETTFTIAKAPSTTTITCALPVTYTGAALTPCSAEASGAGTVTGTPELTYTDNTDAGTASVTAHYAGDANHEPSDDDTTFEIGKASSSIDLSCPASVVYNASAQEPCTATVSAIGEADFGVDVDYAHNTDAGTALASAVWGGDGNHEGSTAHGGFIIDQAPSVTTVDCPTTAQTFTGSAIEPCTAKVTGPGLNEALDVSYSANVHPGGVDATAGYDGDENHLASQGGSHFDIVKADSSITIDCTLPVSYDMTAKTPCTATATGAGGLSADVTASLVYGNNVNAGTATVDASYPGDDDHNGTTGHRTFAIDKAASTITVTCPASVLFTGSPIKPCTAHVTGPGLDQDIDPLSYANNTAAGTASASASYGGDGNHASAGPATKYFTIGHWSLSGFFKPVDMPPVVNIVKGGSTVPLKFTAAAGGTEITDPAVLKGTFVANPMNCQTNAAASDDLFVTTGNTTLRYDATAHQWIQNWQTPTGANKCYQVVLTTWDGSQLIALFKTK